MSHACKPDHDPWSVLQAASILGSLEGTGLCRCSTIRMAWSTMSSRQVGTWPASIKANVNPPGICINTGRLLVPNHAMFL